MATARKKRPLDPAALERKRKHMRERKAEERARRDPVLFAEQKAREERACLNWDEKLAPHIHPIEHGSHKGCWLWRGGYHVSYGQARPVVRAGQYGRQHGDVAVYCAFHGLKRLQRGAFLKRVCGNLRCVSPLEGHALMTNRTVENAKKRLAKLGADHGHSEQEEQGRGQPGRLPRAV